MKSNYYRTIFPLHSYETIQFSYNLLEVVYDIKNKFVTTEGSNIVLYIVIHPEFSLELSIFLYSYAIFAEFSASSP